MLPGLVSVPSARTMLWAVKCIWFAPPSIWTNLSKRQLVSSRDVKNRASERTNIFIIKLSTIFRISGCRIRIIKASQGQSLTGFADLTLVTLVAQALQRNAEMVI